MKVIEKLRVKNNFLIRCKFCESTIVFAKTEIEKKKFWIFTYEAIKCPECLKYINVDPENRFACDSEGNTSDHIMVN